MRYIHVVLALSLICPAVQAADAAKRITLEAIFEDGGLDTREPQGLVWLPDGDHVLYRFEADEATDLWREHVETGERHKIVSWSVMQKELESQRPGWQRASMSDPNAASSSRRASAVSPDGSLLVGSAAGDLFRLDLESGEARFLTGDGAMEYFPTFSPDGARLAFVRDADLYSLELKTGVVCRLTDRGDKDHLLNGIADWVYEEELGTNRSFWWSPDGRRILFLQYDVSPVGLVPIVDSSGLYPVVEYQRYPKAGTPNPVVRLGVIDVDGGAPVFFDAGIGEGYCARAGWTPGGQVWLQRLNRDQNVLELVLLDSSTGDGRILLSDKDPAWVDVADDLYFLADGRFLWTSVRDGWRHLALHAADGTLERQLTSGAWQVTAVYGLDVDEKTAFFQANRNNLRQRHLFRVELVSGEISPMGSAAGGVHSAVVAPGGAYLIDTWSALGTPPRADVVASDGSIVRELWRSGDGLDAWDLLPIESGSFIAQNGVELHSLLFRPRDFKPEQTYPVVLYVYGGPHSQLTQDRWGGSIHHFLRFLADQGIAVFMVDNRGTFGRGHDFETAVYRRLGEFEVVDQLAAVRWLKNQPWVDGERIAAYGGSYGGYMTLMLLLQAPETFRAGIAYAPVTDWRFYDTIYTERYMDTPEENAEGYAASAPLTYADALDSALLLVLGNMDNNVHPQNTLQLVGKLAAVKKDFELMIYPQTRHGVRRSAFAPHFHRLKVEFLRRHLLGHQDVAVAAP